MKQILFNLIVFVLELVTLTNLFLTPKEKLFAGLCFVLIFWLGNLYFLHHADLQQFPEHLHSLQDYLDALKRWRRKSTPFRQEIRTAMHQLELFRQKQRTLTAFSNQFQEISEQTEACLLTNINKMLRRLLTLDSHDSAQTHKTYLNLLLHQNQNILNQYDSFLNEVFQLDSAEPPCLEVLTAALRDVRKQSF